MGRDLADRVRNERLSRKWSVRRAATETHKKKGREGVSNSYWANFENGTQPLTPLLSQAIAIAFDWPDTWPETASPSSDEVAALRREVDALVLAVKNLTETVERQGAELRTRRGRPPRPGVADGP